MQLYPLAPEPVPSDSDSVSPDVPTARTFCVVWQTGGPDGPRWKADVVADNAFSAAHAVVYDRSLSQEQVVGIIDRSTIR